MSNLVDMYMSPAYDRIFSTYSLKVTGESFRPSDHQLLKEIAGAMNYMNPSDSQWKSTRQRIKYETIPGSGSRNRCNFDRNAAAMVLYLVFMSRMQYETEISITVLWHDDGYFTVYVEGVPRDQKAIKKMKYQVSPERTRWLDEYLAKE